MKQIHIETWFLRDRRRHKNKKLKALPEASREFNIQYATQCENVRER